MTEISAKSLRMLKKINRIGYLPEDQIPAKINRYRLEMLVENGLIDIFVLVPPGKEGYENGLIAYKLSPQGEDAVYKYRKVQREARIALILSILALLVAVLDVFAPVDEWVKALFNK